MVQLEPNQAHLLSHRLVGHILRNITPLSVSVAVPDSIFSQRPKPISLQAMKPGQTPDRCLRWDVMCQAATEDLLCVRTDGMIWVPGPRRALADRKYQNIRELPRSKVLIHHGKSHQPVRRCARPT